MAVQYRVKKVSPYPISAQFVSRFGPTPAKILKLTQIGMIAEIGETKFQPGDKLEMSWEYPVILEWMKENGVVVKLYNKFNESMIPEETRAPAGAAKSAAPATAGVAAPASGLAPSPHHGANFGQVQHLAEIHFRPLTEDGKKKLDRFLALLSKPPGA